MVIETRLPEMQCFTTLPNPAPAFVVSHSATSDEAHLMGAGTVRVITDAPSEAVEEWFGDDSAFATGEDLAAALLALPVPEHPADRRAMVPVRHSRTRALVADVSARLYWWASRREWSGGDSNP